MVYLVLEYAYADDYLERRPAYRDKHLALIGEAVDRGEIVLAGPLTDPYDRALIVWAEQARASAEAFVAVDPYVTEGLVLSWQIRPWNVVAGTALPDAAPPA